MATDSTHVAGVPDEVTRESTPLNTDAVKSDVADNMLKKSANSVCFTSARKIGLAGDEEAEWDQKLLVNLTHTKGHSTYDNSKKAADPAEPAALSPKKSSPPTQPRWWCCGSDNDVAANSTRHNVRFHY